MLARFSSVLLLVGSALSAQSAPELRVTLVGNAGLIIEDGESSLLVDLPYQPGAFGYQIYDPSGLQPRGRTVSVVTHHHRDHFAREFFIENADWQVVGPLSVTGDIPIDRVLSGDSVQVGAFTVVAVPTPHTPDHRSYRIRWRGRVVYVAGDTQDPTHLGAGPIADILFVPPWLTCAAEETGVRPRARLMLVYHLDPAGSDRICGDARRSSPGDSHRMEPGTSPIGAPERGVIE